MVRAVTGDHILFNECIGAFRRKNDISDKLYFENKSYLLSSFRINETWDLGICKVSPSKEIKLPGAYSAFISTISNPESNVKYNQHLFGIALSAIISFISLKNCKSTRDDYLCMRESLSQQDFLELAIMNPILTSGSGANNVRLSNENEKLLCLEIKNFINLLHNIEYGKYIKLMQSIRMINLSISNKRDDFGLAYFLAVSAIESIAQIAIKRENVKIKDVLESTWKEKAKEDPIFEKLYESYKTLRGNNSYLSERYVKFIMDFAPQIKWIDLVPDPEEYIKKLLISLNEILPNQYDQIIAEKRSFEVYPEELNDSEIKDILSNSYKYRSEFVHQGKQPPHREVNGQKRFFEKFGDPFNTIKDNKLLLPTYDLIVNIAKYSIMNWAESNKK